MQVLRSTISDVNKKGEKIVLEIHEMSTPPLKISSNKFDSATQYFFDNVIKATKNGWTVEVEMVQSTI